MDSGKIKKYIPSYGRRKGRKLTPERKKLMEEWERVFIDTSLVIPEVRRAESFAFVSEPYYRGSRVNGLRSPLAALPSALAGMTASDLWLEIGFGSGEHLAAQAMKNPEIDFIGCETFIDGCGALVKKIDAEKIGNIRIWNEDARLLFPMLPENSVSRAFILFPDPWPKRRHNKRRLINSETLDLLARAMKKNGILRLATDYVGYAEWMIAQIFANRKFRWLAESKTDWQTPPSDHFTTRYQKKSLAGDKYYFIECERI